MFSGDQLDAIDDRLLVRLVQDATVFYRVSPRHKLRIVKVSSFALLTCDLSSLPLLSSFLPFPYSVLPLLSPLS